MTSTWLEVALNGPWTTEKQPNIPTRVADIIAEGIACARAGAAIIHVHAYNPATGRQDDDPDIYAAIIEGIRSTVDVIVYPTIPLAGFPGQPMMGGVERFAHQAELAERGLLEWAVIDPGSVNISEFSAIGRDDPGFVYMNPEDHIRAGLSVANRYGFSPSYAVYEPGFLRLGAALARRYPEIGPPVYRFMFSETLTFGFPPTDWALDSYLALLERETPGAAWMVAGLGVDISPLISAAVASGGHVRVGLEDMPLGVDRRNVALVEAAADAIERARGSVAAAADVRAAMAAGRGERS